MFYKKVPDTEQHSHADAAGEQHAPKNWIRGAKTLNEPLESRQLLTILRRFLGKMGSLPFLSDVQSQSRLPLSPSTTTDGTSKPGV
jgi:hypothetical protein